MITTPGQTDIYTREEAIKLFDEDVGEGFEYLVLEKDDNGPLLTSATFRGEYREIVDGKMTKFTAYA